MGRSWEAYEENVKCDVCGEVKPFVWDFYGDLVCPECAEKVIPRDEING